VTFLDEHRAETRGLFEAHTCGQK